MPCALPTEIWRKVLRHSTEEPSWADLSDFADRSKAATRGILATRTKLAIVLVCSHWRAIGTEFLWENVTNRNLDQLVHIASLLAADSHQPQPRLRIKRGWWIRSLHTRFDFGDNLERFTNTVISILSCCPNLNSYSHVHDFNGPLPSSIVGALKDHCRSTLVRFQLDWGGVDLDDLHLLLKSDDEPPSALQHISVGCTFAPLPLAPAPSQRPTVVSPHLRSLHFGNSEDGMIRKFNCHLIEAALWSLPALTSVSIDVDARTSVQELVGFLQPHGNQLQHLTLTDSGPRVDGLTLSWNQIFALCPNLIQLRLSYNPFLQHAVTGQLAPLVSAAYSDTARAPAAKRLERLSFARWEFMGFSESSPLIFSVSAGGDEEDEVSAQPTVVNEETPTSTAPSLVRISAYLKHVLDLEFEALGGALTPALKYLEFDFNAGHIDLPRNCGNWWQHWIATWRQRGLVVQGCNRERLDADTI